MCSGIAWSVYHDFLGFTCPAVLQVARVFCFCFAASLVSPWLRPGALLFFPIPMMLKSDVPPLQRVPRNGDQGALLQHRYLFSGFAGADYPGFFLALPTPMWAFPCNSIPWSLLLC